MQSPTGEMRVIDGPEGASDAEITKAAQDLFGQSALEAGTRAAVNNLPLGGQLGALGTAAIKGTDYSQGMQEFNQKAAEAKAEHPIAYGAGAVAGSAAPLAIPVVGEAMEAAPALTGAALGAANAVGNTDIAQHPEEALKQAGEGAITGGIIGKALPSGSGAAEDLENYANRKTVEAAKLPAGLLNMPKEDIESLGSTMHEMGIDSGSIDDKINTAAAKLKEIGSQIGALGQNIPPLQDAEPFINQLHDKITESGDIFGAGSNPEAPLYQAGIDKLSQPGLRFEDLQKMKTAIGQRAFDALGNIKNDAAANLYGTYKDAMKSMVEAAPQEYQKLMDQYGDLLDINHALGKTRGMVNAGGAESKGGIGMAGRLGSAVTGGNVPATAGIAGLLGATGHPMMAAGALTGITQNPGVMAGASRALSDVLPGISSAAKMGGINSMVSHFINNMPSYGKFAAPLSQAIQTGGTRGFAASSFVLRQQHPELNDLMMKQEGADDETNR